MSGPIPNVTPLPHEILSPNDPTLTVDKFIGEVALDFLSVHLGLSPTTLRAFLHSVCDPVPSDVVVFCACCGWAMKARAASADSGFEK
jgi:hypothetical protein